ncbi:MAG: hypothetical protein FWE06_07605 [Oscillospiraceae bacterium]|nr:hypothetical protein [Oscillospiraceae bacterium]
MSIRKKLNQQSANEAEAVAKINSLPNTKRYPFRKLALTILVVAKVLSFTACGGDPVVPPETPGYVTPEIPETPETPTTPPENGPGYYTPPTTPETPTTPEEPGTGETPIDRRRHTEIRTGTDSASPVGLGISARGTGNLTSEQKQAFLREVAEDINYAFAEQLNGPDGAVAKFNWHFTPQPNPALGDGGHSGWITLDIPSTGQSLVVTSANFGPRGAHNVDFDPGHGQRVITVTPETFADFLTNQGVR